MIYELAAAWKVDTQTQAGVGRCLTLNSGVAGSAIEPPFGLAKLLPGHQELKRTAGVTTGPQAINLSQAKATKGKAGMAGDAEVSVRRSTAGTGLRVGEASADLPATSEHMDVTAGETAPNSRDGASEKVGGFPVPAAPQCGVNRRNRIYTTRDAHGTPHGSGVTAGETAPSLSRNNGQAPDPIEGRS